MTTVRDYRADYADSDCPVDALHDGDDHRAPADWVTLPNATEGDSVTLVTFHGNETVTKTVGPDGIATWAIPLKIREVTSLAGSGNDEVAIGTGMFVPSSGPRGPRGAEGPAGTGVVAYQMVPVPTATYDGDGTPEVFMTVEDIEVFKDGDIVLKLWVNCLLTPPAGPSFQGGNFSFKWDDVDVEGPSGEVDTGYVEANFANVSEINTWAGPIVVWSIIVGATKGFHKLEVFWSNDADATTINTNLGGGYLEIQSKPS